MGTICAPPFLPSNLLNNPKHGQDLIHHEFLWNNPSFIFLLVGFFILFTQTPFVLQKFFCSIISLTT